MASVECIRLAYNSVYLLETGGIGVLIDTGPDYRGSREAIDASLAGRLPDVILATHGHIDHAGLGAWWQSRGVALALGADDHPLAATGGIPNDAEMERYAACARSCGAPEVVVGQAMEALHLRRELALGARGGAYPEVRRGRWPSGLRFEPFDAGSLESTQLPEGMRVLASPGHTPGNVVLVEEHEGWLFSGDQLLAGTTPTPAIQFHAATGARLRSLPEFAGSLRKVAAVEATRCFPGHGGPFDNVAAAIAHNLGEIEARSERVLRSLVQAGPASAYELAARLYPRALDSRFWQIISTVLGHLDILEGERRAEVTEAGAWAAMG